MALASRTLVAGGHLDLAIELSLQAVAASTQNQALSALLLLYKAVLQQDIGWIDEIVGAKKPKRLPVVLIREEVMAVLQHLSEQTWLLGSLLYGSGFTHVI